MTILYTIPNFTVHTHKSDLHSIFFDELIKLKSFKKTSNLHENSGTVEYFAGQSNFRLTGPQGKWVKKSC